MRFFFPLKKYISPDLLADEKPVSILICTHNDLLNLKENLFNFLKQELKSLEIVIVDDASTDGTWQFLEEKSRNFPELKIIKIPEKNKEYKGKKYALLQGVLACTHDIILVTDADCVPNSNQWARLMSQMINDRKKIILGYGPYDVSDDFLGNMIASETSMTAMLYTGFAIQGLPYMGVGRNICYHKSVLDLEKLESIKNHLSGDDDLFLQKIMTPTNVAIQFHQNAHMYSRAARSYSQWFAQKRRHLSVAKAYPFTIKFLLLIWSLMLLVFMLGCMILIGSIFFYQPYYIYIGFGLMAILLNIDLSLQKSLSKFSFKTVSTRPNSLLRLVYYSLYLVLNAKQLFQKTEPTWNSDKN